MRRILGKIALMVMWAALFVLVINLPVQSVNHHQLPTSGKQLREPVGL
jgi:hypothetical protein